MSEANRQAEAEIRALIEAWSRAIEAKDPDAIVAAYTPNTVIYDAIPPGKTVGAKAIRDIWAQCLPYFPKKFRSEHKDLDITVDGDVAFVHALHRFVPDPPDHPCGMTCLRVTACYKRSGGAWQVAHEHVSVPFDPMTARAVYLDADYNALPSPGVPDTSEGCVTAMPDGALLEPSKVTPHLICAGAADAIAFYQKAFGATELMRLPGPDGRLLHACVAINGAPVMLADEFKDAGAHCNTSPSTLGGTPVSIHLNVSDANAFFDRAVSAGARVVMPVADMFWGDRYGVVEDPFGHHWAIATQLKKLSMDEIKAAAAAAMPPASSATI